MTWEQREAKLLEKKRRSVNHPIKAVNDERQILFAPSQSSEAAGSIAETAVATPEPREAGGHMVERSKFNTTEQREAALLERKRWLVDGPRKAVSKDEQLLIAPRQSSEAATKIAETAMAMPEPSAAGVGQAERSSNGVASVRGYVISISGKRRVRRLQFVGLCHRLPGLDFLDYECHDDELPAGGLYDDYCHQCWRTGPPVQRGEDSVVTESESSSTGSEGSGRCHERSR